MAAAVEAGRRRRRRKINLKLNFSLYVHNHEKLRKIIVIHRKSIRPDRYELGVRPVTSLHRPVNGCSLTTSESSHRSSLHGTTNKVVPQPGCVGVVPAVGRPIPDAVQCGVRRNRIELRWWQSTFILCPAPCQQSLVDSKSRCFEKTNIYAVR